MGELITHNMFLSLLRRVLDWALLLLLTIFRIIVVWVFGILLYRLYFHPLARYPGPLLAKITDWYNVYHCFVGDRHLEFYRIHQRYGKIVRYGPNRVSICSNSALQTIYGPRANVQKSSNFGAFLWFFDSWSSQTMIDTAKFQHASKRQVLTRALGVVAVESMEESMLQSIRTFCRLLADDCVRQSGSREADWSSPQDVAVLAGRLSFDVMNQICFGHGSDTLEKEENRYMLGVLSDGAQYLNTISHMQTLLYTGAHKLLFRNLLHGLERYKTYSRLQSERCLRTEKNDPSGNVFSTLSHAPHPTLQRPLYTPDELRSESSLLIIAGSDTTSTCIAATLFYLLHNAPALARLQAAIDATFPSLEAIRSGPLLSRCQYLRACITESLRLSPPVGGLMAREVLTGGMEVDGRVFPKGTEIGTPHYALHHDAAYYPAPFLYQPERWLAGAGHDVATAQSAFSAFSLGPRGCVGKAMAYQELMTVLARVLWQYDVRLASQDWLGAGGGHEKWQGSRDRADEYQLFDTFSSRSVGPLVQFRPRRHAGL